MFNRENMTQKYLYGPGSILVAHSENEYMNINDLLSDIEKYKDIALRLLYG